MAKDAAYQHKEAESKIEDTLAHLSRLLEATPSAEELSQSWARSNNETLQRDGPRLQDLRRALDAGKIIKRNDSSARGIPMWIVVRMCKATWHRDGTWPLLGADEEAPAAAESMAVVRSIHSSAMILRPKGTTSFQVPAEEADVIWRKAKAIDLRKRKEEPNADEIAASYRLRGLYVEEAAAAPNHDMW